MKNTIKYNVSNDEDNIRIDRWLRRKFSKLPQSFFEKKLRKGLIRLNKKIIKANTKVLSGDWVEIRDFDKSIYAKKIINKNIKLSKTIIAKFKNSIIFENEDYMIINKWKGIATQGGSNIVYSIDEIIKNLSPKISLVHRLDKETSGALLISKNYKTSRFFGNLFKEKKINKIYLAVCNKCPREKSGIIKLKINKHKKRKDLIKSSRNVTESITEYKLLEYKNNVSTILFFPVTGKMHQIRIVAKYIGCSVLGDNKYGNFIADNKIDKLMLHSFAISFVYNNEKKLYFAKLDPEMTKNFKKLGLKIPKENSIRQYF